jgi:aminoglycoside 6'-N-acetyltransferase I
MEQILTTSSGVFLAEDKDGRLIGFVEFSIRNDYVPGSMGGPTPYLEGWYVEEAMRGTGVGHLLLKTLEEWARGKGYKQLASDADINNTLSINVHIASGFREVEREVHFIKSLEYNNPL